MHVLSNLNFNNMDKRTIDAVNRTFYLSVTLGAVLTTCLTVSIFVLW